MIKPHVQENVVVNKPVVVALKNTNTEAQTGALVLSVGDEVRSCRLDGEGPADQHDITLTASEELTVRISEWSKPGDSEKSFHVAVKTDDGNESHGRVIH
jgi:hypothetical protein